ncbi:MAG: helix-turn-helix domain-containing protein [Acidimicrobiia bacterium]
MTDSFGGTIRDARRERGLTQTQLAEISGIRQPNISAIESGRRLPSADTLLRLLVSCGGELVATVGAKQLPCVPPDDWFDDETSAGAPPLGSDLPVATRARMLVAALDASEAVLRSR